MAFTTFPIPTVVVSYATTSTDNAVVRFNGTTGGTQNSSAILDDSGNLAIVGLLTTAGILSVGSVNITGSGSFDITGPVDATGSINLTDLTSTSGSAEDFFQSDFFGNPADGNVVRLNRILTGTAVHASGNIEVAPDAGVWTDTYWPGTVNYSQIASITAIGTLGVSGFARTSDYRTWAAPLTSGGAQGVNGFGLNDDLTVSTTPIAVGVFGSAIHLNTCNGITLHQLDTENRGAVVDATPYSEVTSGSQYSLGLTSGLQGAANNVTAGIYFHTNGTERFRKGIVFFWNSLDTTIGQGGKGVAVDLATEHSIRWLHNEATVTITIATPAVVTWTAHGLPANTPVQFRVAGATNPNAGNLPTGISLGVTYYVKSPATDTFNISATPGGSDIATSGTQAGTIFGCFTAGEIWSNTSHGLTLQSAVGVTVVGGELNLAPTTTAHGSLFFPAGTAPSSPVDGEVWREDNTNTGLKIRVNGVTKTITLS